MTDPGRPRVLITNPVSAETRAALERFASVSIAPDPGAETLRKAVGEADILVVRVRLPEDIFDNAHRLLGAVRHGVGLDFIPVEAATRLGILVANVPGANAGAVAEYCVMQMLNLLRRPDRAERSMRADGWEKARASTPQGRELGGCTVGILGFGAIGSRLAHILHFGFQAQVAVCTRRPDSLPHWARPLALDELVAVADFVVPCLPLTEDTRRFLDSAMIGRMKPTACVVNASRGGVIDEAALLSALAEGRIAGAALDVFDEPNPQPGGAVMLAGNVSVTPHMAGNTRDALARIGLQCASEARRILEGEKPQSFANPQAWDRHLERRRTLARRALGA